MAKDDKKQKQKKRSLIQTMKNDQENGARRAFIEELFNDVYEHRRRIYLVNFTRGLFFGLGSVLGGTILLALLIWLLAQLGAIIPFLSEFIQQILDALNIRNT